MAPLSLVALLGLGCSDNTIKTYSEPPSVTIQVPADGSTLDQAVAIEMRGLVTDDEYSASLSSLTVQWSMDGTAICDGSVADDGGNIDCVYAFPTAGEHTLRLTVTNPDGASDTAEAQVTVTPNSAPTASITLPEPGGVYYSDQITYFEGLVADGEDALDALSAVWTSNLDGELDVDGEPTSAGELSGATVLSEGDHLITLTVQDTTGLTGEDTVLVTVGPPNQAPACAITSPINNESFEIGETVLFQGSATDPDVPANWLTVEWSSDRDGVISTDSPTSAGDLNFARSDLSPGTHSISLTVTDENGADCSDAVLLTIGNGPTIAITEPLTGDVFNQGENISFTAQAVDEDDSPTTLAILWSSSLDGTLSTASADSGGFTTFTTTGLSRGDHTITVLATDPDGYYGNDTVRLTINGLPSAPGVSISPDPPKSSDALLATITSPSTDPEGASLSYQYAWYRNSTATGITSADVDASSTTRGETWRVDVVAHDGSGSGPIGSDSVVIGNSAPSLSSASISPSAPSESDTLSCLPGPVTDEDGDSVSYGYRWSVDGSDPGVTTSTLSSSRFSRGAEVICTITPYDGYDYGSPVSSDPVEIGNTAPSLSSVNLSPTSAFEATTLTCSPSGGTDADGDSVSYVYDWIVSGTRLGLDVAAIAGAWFDRDDTVVCEATPTDGSAFGSPVLSNTVTIRNSAPTVASASLSPSSASESSTLTCTAGVTGDDDGDSVRLVYGWLVNGRAEGGDSATLTGAWFNRGDTVSCNITPDDGADTGTRVDSGSIVIGNSAPSLASVSISPSAPSEGDTLSCLPGEATDADGDSISYSYSWSIGGVDAGVATSSLSSSRFSTGDIITCTVTPSDGITAGSPVSSDPVEIGNSAPSLASVALTPTTAYEGTTLSCSPSGGTDPDGDPVSYVYDWIVSGTRLGLDTSALAGAWFDKTDSVVCEVTPTDGYSLGSAVLSNTVTIRNSLPTVASASLSPSTATETTTLTCTAGITGDDDGDSVSLSYGWLVNSAPAGSGTATLTGSAFNRGDTVSCHITPDDGTDSGTRVSSSSLTIGNSAPTLSSVAISPTDPVEGDTLTCTPSGGADLDGDSISYSYRWSVDGADPGVTSATLASSRFVTGDIVYCTVTPTDGITAGSPVSSDTVEIGNSAPSVASVSLTPTTAYESTTLTCTPTGGTDPDGDAVSYEYDWIVSGTRLGVDSSALAGAWFDRTDSVVCEVTPTDGGSYGAAVLSNTVTIRNSLPTVASATLSPSTATETTTLTCVAGVTGDDDGDAVSLSYGWQVNGAATAAGSTTLSGASFNRGDTVSCNITPNDGVSAGTRVDSSTLTVGNTAPTLASVSISPSSPSESDTLSCLTSGASDLDGDAVSTTYRWTVDGADAGVSTSTLGSSRFSRDDVVTCTATPTDGITTGSPVTSDAVVIGNSAPTLSSVALTPTTAYETSTLTCTPSGASDPDGDVVSYEYDWIVAGARLGLDTSSMAGAWFDKGDSVVCEITPTDGSRSGSPVLSNTVTIRNSLPSVASATLSPSTATESTTLSCLAGVSSDADGDSVSLTYGWLVDGVSTGTSASTLTGSAYGRGDVVSCHITPYDGSESGSRVNSSSVTIGNTAPTLSSVSITPTDPVEGDTLSCNPSGATDVDGDSVSYSYRWFVDGVDAGVTSSTLGSSRFGTGDMVYCVVTPTDGTTAGSAVNSDTVEIGNTAPTLSSVALTPTTAYESSTLTCTPSGGADADGDPVSYDYDWIVAGARLGRDSSTLSGTWFDKSQAVVCEVTPTDGRSSGLPVLSNTVTIRNSVPVVTSVSLSPSTATESTTLTCTPGSTSDGDGDTVSLSYGWIVDGSTLSATGSTLTGSWFGRGDNVSCFVTPNDGTEAGARVDSAIVTIGNTAPSISSVSISPSAPVEGDTLTCNPAGGADIDGDSISYSYRWSVDGSDPGVTSSTLGSSRFSRGNLVTCTVTPSDGTSAGTSRTSDPVEIGNSAPTLSAVNLSPTEAYESSSMSCVPSGASDPDGDAISYQYDWLVNGSRLGLDMAAIGGAWFSRGDSVVCEVSPTDGSADGSAVLSNTVTIRNSLPTVALALLSPSSGTESTTFYCSSGSTADADGDTVSTSVGWKVNGAIIGSTSSSLTGSSFNKGDTLSCFITPNDGTSSGSIAESATVTISNSAPSLTSVELSPTTPYTDEDITAAISGATDADGDPVSTTYAWYRDGVLVSGVSGTRLDDIYTTKHQEIYVVATPSDGTSAGVGIASDVVIVENTLPTAPAVGITPTDAEPTDDLLCGLLVGSSDLDGDSISYVYAWYLDGVLSGITSSTLDDSYTEDGDTWTCQVTPFDGDGYGAADSASQAIVDRTAPDQPILAAIDPYRNDNSVTISGTCEPSATITLYKACTDGTLVTSEFSASTAGTFSVSQSVPDGEVCDFYAYAEDEHGNVSPISNVVSTEACDPVDSYEDGTGTGDTCSDAIDDWTILGDDGTSVSITGNIIDTTDSDWYVFETSQSVLSSGVNDYNFEVVMSTGGSDYAFAVYRGGCGTEALECGSTEGSGWDQYDFYARDYGGYHHSIPSDSRSCNTGSPFYNNCDDLSETYYIHVFRTDADLSCNAYSLTVSNGVW